MLGLVHTKKHANQTATQKQNWKQESLFPCGIQRGIDVRGVADIAGQHRFQQADVIFASVLASDTLAYLSYTLMTKRSTAGAASADGIAIVMIEARQVENLPAARRLMVARFRGLQEL